MIDNKTERIKLIDLGLSSTKNYSSGNELPVEGQIYIVLVTLMIDGASSIMYNKFSRLEYLVTKFLSNSNALEIKSMNDYYDYIFVKNPKVNKERIGYDLRRDKKHIFTPFKNYSKFYYHSYEDVIKEINKLVEKK